MKWKQPQIKQKSGSTRSGSSNPNLSPSQNRTTRILFSFRAKAPVTTSVTTPSTAKKHWWPL